MARKKRRSRQFKKSSRVINMEEARQQRLQKRQTAREEAERERTASDERRIRRKRALRKKQSFRRILVGLIIVVMLGFLCASITGIVMLKKEQHEVLKKQEQLKEEKAKLKEDLKNINDKESIEEQAREKLKLVKPGETIYIPYEN